MGGNKLCCFFYPPTGEYESCRSRKILKTCAYSCYRSNFRPPAEKKAKTKRFYTPPLGGKKTTEFVSPPKESFGKSKGVWVDFVFKVGGKIGWVDFCVQSRSQNRFVTILNSYMGGGGYSHLFLTRPPLRPTLRPMFRPM